MYYMLLFTNNRADLYVLLIRILTVVDFIFL